MPRPTVLPTALLFDVNETLSDLTPLADVFGELGAPPALAQAWLAGVLRDGISLACGDATAPFVDIARDVSRRMLAPYLGDPGHLDDAVDRVLGTFTTLGVHADVAPGLRALAEAGARLVTLSNGAASVAEELLERADLAAVVERCLSVEDAGVWKPAGRAYTWACAELDVEPVETMLVAVHPWDTDGAARAGLASAWVDRTSTGRTGAGLGFPAHFTPPTLRAGSLVELASLLH